MAAEVSAKMVEKNSIVNLQFYPDERDKGHRIRHHDLEEALVAIALGYLRVEGKL